MERDGPDEPVLVSAASAAPEVEFDLDEDAGEERWWGVPPSDASRVAPGRVRRVCTCRKTSSATGRG